MNLLVLLGLVGFAGWSALRGRSAGLDGVARGELVGPEAAGVTPS